MNLAGEVNGSLTPLLVRGLHGLRIVAAAIGHEHAALLDARGRVLTLGSNSCGQRGQRWMHDCGRGVCRDWCASVFLCAVRLLITVSLSVSLSPQLTERLSFNAHLGMGDSRPQPGFTVVAGALAGITVHIYG